MRKFLILIFVIGSFLSCGTKREKNEPSALVKQVMSAQSKSLLYLDSIHCMNYYTDSKWKIYLKYCDKKIEKDDLGNKLNETKYFGELPVYLTSARKENDSLLNLNFEAILYDSMYVNNESFMDASLKYTFNRYLYYSVNKNSLYGYGIGAGIRVDSAELNDYCNGVPNCNKKGFIEEHKKEMDSWFIKEAVRRKFIEE